MCRIKEMIRKHLHKFIFVKKMKRVWSLQETFTKKRDEIYTKNYINDDDIIFWAIFIIAVILLTATGMEKKFFSSQMQEFKKCYVSSITFSVVILIKKKSSTSPTPIKLRVALCVAYTCSFLREFCGFYIKNFVRVYKCIDDNRLVSSSTLDFDKI